MAKVAQFCLRGSIAHIQYGTAGHYEKIDTNATADMKAAFAASKAAGVTRNSLFGSETQYAPLEVKEVSQRVFSFVPPPAPMPEGFVVYVDNA